MRIYYNFRIEDNKYIWESEDIRLVYSNPSIQAFKSGNTLKSDKDILYFYYTLEGFKSKLEYNEETGEEISSWERVFVSDIFDSPGIFQLKAILNELFSCNCTIDGEKYIYPSGKIQYSKHFSTENFPHEDFYEVTKYVDDKNTNSYYSFYFGGAIDSQGDFNSTGIRLSNLSLKEMKNLYQCISSFISNAIKEKNQQISDYLDIHSKNKFIKDNRLYSYVIDKKDMTEVIDFSNFASILIEGDYIRTLTYCVSNSKTIKCKDLNNIRIKEIKKDSIIFSNNKEIDVNKILSFYTFETSKVYYDKEQVKEDFFNALSDDDIDEFRNSPIDILLEKYWRVILERGILCRPEHNFLDSSGNYYTINNIKEFIRDIFEEVKNTL